MSESRTGGKFYQILTISDARTTEIRKLNDFLQKTEKGDPYHANGPVISQSDCRKTGPYQLPHKKSLQYIYFIIGMGKEIKTVKDLPNIK